MNNSMVFKKRLPLLVFIIPSFILMILFLYYPFVSNFLFSFKQMKSATDNPWTRPFLSETIWMDGNKNVVSLGEYSDRVSAGEDLSDSKAISVKNRTTVIYTDGTEVRLSNLTGQKQANGLILFFGGEMKVESISTQAEATESERVVFYPKDNTLYVNEAYEAPQDDLNVFRNVEKLVIDGATKYPGDLFRNYKDVIRDKGIQTAYVNTLLMMLTTIVFQVGIAIILAILVDNVPKGAQFFRTVYFFPIVIAAAALGVFFKVIFWSNPYQQSEGMLNTLITSTGGKYVDWKTDAHYVMLFLPVVWQYIGFYFVILATGLNNISDDIYEAACIDGVSPLQKVQFITLPLLRNTICTCLTLGITGSLKVFDLPFILLGQNANNGKDWLLGTYLNFYRDTRVDYASTIAIVMVVLGVVISQIASRLFSQKDY